MQGPPSPSSSSSSSFPTSATAPEFPRHGRNTSQSYTGNGEPPPSPLPPSSSAAHSRRHSRLHSRNLSIFFPRPGSLPHSSIAEDGTQELDYSNPPATAPVTLMPSPKLGENFTFGRRPPASAGLTEGTPGVPGANGAKGSRRGHHHKHSLSHNFFSFLEPGSDLHSQPTPTPVSPWNPISPFPQSADPTTTSFPLARLASPTSPQAEDVPFALPANGGSMEAAAAAVSVAQFALGAWLWVSGQQVGSLACTGLGYWAVFDALGVAVARVLPAYLRKPTSQSRSRRPYGNKRVETVALFTQAVYLMFSAVYVFKETVEHLLLSAGEGHHHHSGDEEVGLLGIDFPLLLLILTLSSFVGSALAFANHARLVEVAGNALPPLASLLNPSRFRYSQRPDPTTPFARLLANPYSVVPLATSAIILVVPFLTPSSTHRTFDLLLAGAQAFAMFRLAYPACVTIGTVLLQTSPARGLASGRMEAFLRAMREIERHPQVLHLPPPHIWQLAPADKALVVTLELRVARVLGDADVLRLTRWAWERCTQALGGEGEVTVGIVRG
ncbi:hypothetical protein FA95DRAFT_1499203 [Auriscalpium vulgare]|uniref:Uncharacterized protein n=1 Tax=Auriscalpium vulgare TaxID=40419 RepID=A0ACB8RGB9_9AGAM|nr:hypothetical protein FA95DRAFT_1499203 [Auriscalpium vulgare]